VRDILGREVREEFLDGGEWDEGNEMKLRWKLF